MHNYIIYLKIGNPHTHQRVLDKTREVLHCSTTLYGNSWVPLNYRLLLRLYAAFFKVFKLDGAWGKGYSTIPVVTIFKIFVPPAHLSACAYLSVVLKSFHVLVRAGRRVAGNLEDVCQLPGVIHGIETKQEAGDERFCVLSHETFPHLVCGSHGLDTVLVHTLSTVLHVEHCNVCHK